MTIQPQSLLIQLIATSLEDPLIDWRTEKVIQILVWILIIAIASVVGLISRRLEQAIFFAIISSIITIAFFVIG